MAYALCRQFANQPLKCGDRCVGVQDFHAIATVGITLHGCPIAALHNRGCRDERRVVTLLSASPASSAASAWATTSPAIRRASSANHSWDWFADIDPFAAILVPSIEITPTLTFPCASAQPQDLREQVSECVVVGGPESGDRGVIRGVLAAQDTERDMVNTQSFDPSRRSFTNGIGVDHQRKEHLRVVTLAADTAGLAGCVERRGVELGEVFLTLR